MAATQKKPTSTSKKTPARKSSTNRSRTSNGRKAGYTRKNSGQNKGNQDGLSRYKDEITIVVTLVVVVILFLSNFNLSGSVGTFINRFTFGLIGLLAYLLPYLLFFCIAFHISNRGNNAATIKLVSAIGLVVITAAFIQLVSIDYNHDWNLGSYYTNSAEHKNGGGIIGGAVYSVMYNWFGFAGTLVILLAIMTLLIMFITEKLFFASLGKKSSEKFKEMKERRDEARREREEAYYEEYGDEESGSIDHQAPTPMQRKLNRAELDRIRKEEQEAIAQAKRNAKEERRRKAKTYTFPKTDHLNEDQMNVTTSPWNQTQTTEKQTPPLDEVNPLKVDAIPITRGTNDQHDFNETPYYKEEMKRKFSQGKDYDIKKLAEQIMNESFDSTSTDVEQPKNSQSTPVELSDSLSGDALNEMNGNDTAKESLNTDFDDDRWKDIIVNSTQNNNLEQDVLHENTDHDASSKDTIEQLQESEDTDFDDFRVDLKALENQEVEHATPVSSRFDSNTLASGSTNMSGLDTSNNTPKDDKNNINKANVPNSIGNEMNQELKALEEPFIYEFPPIDLLSKPKKMGKGTSDNELKETAIKLQQTLQSFGVGVTITNVSCGPVVTRYELQPEQGVKVSKITNLADDIKLNLAAADIRIEAPIPGKAAVGIEVPNKENSAVSFRELIEGKEFKEHSSDLAFAVGKDIGGQIVVTDIAKMPHLLIAGATGSGKSVCINTLIMSILYKAHPDDVKLIMVDPKVVELSVYNGIPHLLIPVVTDPKKASAALNWAVMEMTDRYNRFAEIGVRDIKGYNSKIKKVEEYNDERFKKMPQIVIIVDELADLMMVAPGEVEDAICRLAQMARAAGIHLIIATQRPSVNVITGLIKANVPSRIAFSVSSAIDSRTIIDSSGAEKLLGKGDMLFFPSGYPKPVRIQGAFVSDKEVSEIVNFLSSQSRKPAYNDDITSKITSVSSSEGAQSSASDRDDYFVEAGKFIIDKDKASIGMLQRVYKIGFNRAARIMDQLYEAGVVGPEEGTKPRKVLMSEEEFEQYVDEYV